MPQTIEKTGPPPLTKQQYAYRAVRQHIQSGGIQPGQRLVQRQIAEQLGLSIGPVRSAFLRLEGEGLLAHSGNHRLSFVEDFDSAKYQELIVIRRGLEGAAVRLAAMKRTDEDLAKLQTLVKKMSDVDADAFDQFDDLDEQFHHAIFKAAHSKLLERLYETGSQLHAMSRRDKGPRREQLVCKSIKEHTQIFQAITNQRSDDAEDLMHKHVR